MLPVLFKRGKIPQHFGDRDEEDPRSGSGRDRHGGNG